MKQNNRAVGTAYEQIAGRFLEKKGFQILEYNYRCRAGEIDLIARDREYLVFCEVKYRRTKSAGSALEAVDTKKQKRLYRCAQQYVAAHKIPDAAARFDVVAIEGNEVCHIENAFEGALPAQVEWQRLDYVWNYLKKDLISSAQKTCMAER